VVDSSENQVIAEPKHYFEAEGVSFKFEMDGPGKETVCLHVVLSHFSYWILESIIV
jgi:hypothetical protein